MIKFLDLDTGYSFDGFWKNDQTKGYTFWFPNEQSTNISYSMPICILTDDPKEILLKFEDNEIFSILESANTEYVIDGYVFKEPKCNKELTIGTLERPFEKLNDKWYGYIVYIIGEGKYSGEFICKMNIGDEGFIRVGADFYEEYEPTKINLANFGVEIPEDIQKTIYSSNVHEDKQDNILVNRKFKELLSNYWDIVANKGSYKSLINSLKWFEWGDLLRIKEIWKTNNAGISTFVDRNISPIFEGKSTDYFENYIKTTYISLYCSLSTEQDTYDIEENPKLTETVFKWSKDDINLKLSLLSQFFGTFFLPIHMSVLHCTAEDTVFTNAIKTVIGTEMSRNDNVDSFESIKTNVKPLHILSNVKAYVKEDTMFANLTKNIEDRFGVDAMTDDTQLLNQYYAGPGAIIPIEFEISNRKYGEFITRTVVKIDNKVYEFHNAIHGKGNSIKFGFNFLATESKQYEIDFAFILSSGKTFNKHIEFNVKDIDNVVLNVYKICAKDDTAGFTYEDFKDVSEFKHTFKIQKTTNSNQPYIQYLPYSITDDSNYKGIKLNRTVVFECKDISEEALNYLNEQFENYLQFHKCTDDALTYLVYVSKRFYEDLPAYEYNEQYKIIRNDLGFYPQFHSLNIISGDTLNDYTLKQDEAICCAAEIDLIDYNIPFNYGKTLNHAEWEFKNSTTDDVYKLDSSSQQPFVAPNDRILTPGYYDIKFRYRLNECDCIHEINLNSAFRIK